MFRALMAALTLSALCACARLEPLVVVAERCHQSSDGGATWSVNSDAQDMDACFELSNHGGQANTLFKWATAADAPAIDWASRPSAPANTNYVDASPYTVDPASADYAADDAAGPACFRQSGANGREHWTRVGGLREAQCFQRDHCSGGLGQGTDEREGRVCYKWAMNAEAPALPWSETLTNPRLSADIPPPRDIYENQFEMTSDSCVENCDYPARIAAGTMLYTRPDSTSPLVGAPSTAECVLVVGFTSLSTPHRGVVLEAHQTFEPGDVVYELAYAGEGDIFLWRRGEEFTVSSTDLVVRWDPAPRTIDPRVGNWHEVVRSNGARGWAKNLETTGERCAFERQ